MATRYEVVINRWRTFYNCDCPPRPASRRDKDLIYWYMHHINNCAPRPIVNLELPEYEGTE